MQNHSSRRRRRQSAAEVDVEHVDVDRALWEFMFNYQQSLEGARKSERGAQRFCFISASYAEMINRRLNSYSVLQPWWPLECLTCFCLSSCPFPWLSCPGCNDNQAMRLTCWSLQHGGALSGSKPSRRRPVRATQTGRLGSHALVHRCCPLTVLLAIPCTATCICMFTGCCDTVEMSLCTVPLCMDCKHHFADAQ